MKNGHKRGDWSKTDGQGRKGGRNRVVRIERLKYRCVGWLAARENKSLGLHMAGETGKKKKGKKRKVKAAGGEGGKVTL